jgi:hypothetical protein
METSPATFSVTATITKAFSLQTLSDLLACGFEGGVGYWCQIVGYTKPALVKSATGDTTIFRHLDYPLTGGAVKCRIVDEDTEDGEVLVLDGAAIQRGLNVMAEKCPRQFNNIGTAMEDAETGDVFIQCCLLGEVVYG